MVVINTIGSKNETREGREREREKERERDIHGQTANRTYLPETHISKAF